MQMEEHLLRVRVSKSWQGPSKGQKIFNWKVSKAIGALCGRGAQKGKGSRHP